MSQQCKEKRGQQQERQNNRKTENSRAYEKVSNNNEIKQTWRTLGQM